MTEADDLRKALSARLTQVARAWTGEDEPELAAVANDAERVFHACQLFQQICEALVSPLADNWRHYLFSELLRWSNSFSDGDHAEPDHPTLNPEQLARLVDSWASLFATTTMTARRDT